jgi:hypothetical protein
MCWLERNCWTLRPKIKGPRRRIGRPLAFRTQACIPALRSRFPGPRESKNKAVRERLAKKLPRIAFIVDPGVTSRREE